MKAKLSRRSNVREGVVPTHSPPASTAIKVVEHPRSHFHSEERNLASHPDPLPAVYFPEIVRLAGNSRSDWFLAPIEQFPTRASITGLDREAFST